MLPNLENKNFVEM